MLEEPLHFDEAIDKCNSTKIRYKLLQERDLDLITFAISALPSNQDLKREECNNFLHNAHVASLIHSSECTQQISHNKTIIDFGKRNRLSLSQQNHQ